MPVNDWYRGTDLIMSVEIRADTGEADAELFGALDCDGFRIRCPDCGLIMLTGGILR